MEVVEEVKVVESGERKERKPRNDRARPRDVDARDICDM